MGIGTFYCTLQPTLALSDLEWCWWYIRREDCGLVGVSLAGKSPHEIRSFKLIPAGA
jgi:hypothetical protein